jgi:hypothetical protein
MEKKSKPEQPQRIRDWAKLPMFWVGFVGWYVTNGLLFLLYTLTLNSEPFAYLPFIVMVANILVFVGGGLIPKFQVVHRGVMIAFASAIVLTIVLSIVALVACFVLLATSGY